MRNTNFLDPNFEAEMVSFHNNRMYPPGYGKDVPMTKMTQEHVNVVSNAASACLLRIEDNCSPVFGRLMRNHAGLLIEVCEMLKHLIASPELPLDGVFELKDKPKPEKPQDNGTAAKSNHD